MPPLRSQIVILTAQEGQGQAVINAHLQLADWIQQQPGAVVFEFHQLTDEPDTFLLYELWETLQAREQVLQTERMKQFFAQLQSLVLAPPTEMQGQLLTEFVSRSSA